MNLRTFEADDVRRLSAGDAQAAQAFVHHFEPLLRIKVRMRSGSTVRAQQIDDAVQETFARVLVALRERRIDDPERFGAFVNRVCENVLHELHRSRARFVPLKEDVAEPASRDDPEASAGRRESIAAAREVLEQLTPRDRDIFKAVLIDHQDKDAVCRRFEVTRDHLRVLVHRAKERFMAAFDQGRGRASSREPKNRV